MTEPVDAAPMSVRPACLGDAADVARLVTELGFPTTEREMRMRLARFLASARGPLVCCAGPEPVGCVTFHVTPALQRPHPVGRITMLIVAREHRGRGAGAMLVRAAEARLREEGCGLVELTSNFQLTPAHAFYEHLGYGRTSFRFAKPLGDST